MFRLLLVASCISLCAAESVSAPPKHCCTLPQWEGMEGAIGGYMQNGKGYSILSQTFVSYDKNNRRIAATTNTTAEGTPVSVKIIQDFNKNTQYTIDLIKKTCQRSQITQPFNNGCIPDNATRYGELVLGFGDNKLVVESYALSIKQPGTRLFATVAVTVDSCMPVSETFQGSIGDINLSETIGFTAVTEGIKDPAVFTPPTICNEPKALEYDVINHASGFRVFGI